MRISTGDRLGPYEVLGSIVAGGMGEVFKARDTRLDRRVASGRRIMAVEVKAGAKIETEVPKELFKAPGSGGFTFDVSGDGKRFLVDVTPQQQGAEQVSVVLNWRADLKR